MDDAAPATIENDAFFPRPAPLEWPPRHGRGTSIAPEAFYGDSRAPEEEVPFTVRFATRPLAFGGLLFLLGWIGILAQRGFLRQLVVGAPVFEEFAKLGLALVIVSALRARRVWLRVPFGWASGAGFGVLEHFLSYSDEPVLMLADRVAFHAAACGLSMAVFTLVEPLPDARSRWLSTLPSSLLHWANNFGAVVLTVIALLVKNGDIIDLAWSLLVTSAAVALTLLAAVLAPRLRPRVERELRRVFPPLHHHAPAPALTTAAASAPTPPAPEPPEAEAAPPEERKPGP